MLHYNDICKIRDISHKLQKYILNARPPWFKIMCVNARRWSKYDQNI